MSYPNSHDVSSSGLPASSGFSTKSQMGLAEVLQMCCLSRRSGQITFRSGESYGYVYLQQGRVLHAMCGVVEGEEAVYQMLTWPGGGFTLAEDILPHKKTVGLTWEQLLFEGAHRADAIQAGAMIPKTGVVTTVEPVISTRAQESQPKLLVTKPDLPPVVIDLTQEYTHVGRAPENEISLPYPSVSNRHCIFILSGPDIVLRDLNSSNGTLVNDEAISEVILRPGDVIQMGTVQMKFEPGIKRPKLINPIPPREGSASLKMESAASESLYHATVKLPGYSPRSPKPDTVIDDNVFVKGQTPINYENLAKPEVKGEGRLWFAMLVILVLTLVLGACYYFFFVR